jgi:hypothetical protein
MKATTIARTMGTTRFIDTRFTGFSYWIFNDKIENKNNNANEKEIIFLLFEHCKFLYLVDLRVHIDRIISMCSIPSSR